MKTTITKLTLLISAFLSTAQASSGPWCDTQLRATNGTDISIRYQVQDYGPGRMPWYRALSNISVSVAHPSLASNDRVSIVWMNPKNGTTPYYSTVLKDVPWNRAGFIGFLNDPYRADYHAIIQPIYTGSSDQHFHVEIAVVINGEWLKDPVTGESNFKFFPENFPGLCANPTR